jgi:hypothetical protein
MNLLNNAVARLNIIWLNGFLVLKQCKIFAVIVKSHFNVLIVNKAA